VPELAAVPPPLPQRALPTAEEDWGAQFGLDDAGHPVAEVQMTSEPPASSVAEEASTASSVASEPTAELDYAGVEAPGGVPSVEEADLPVLPIEEISEDGMPVLTAEPENAEDLAAIAQHEQALTGKPQVFAESAAPGEVSPEPPAEEPSAAALSADAPMELPAVEPRAVESLAVEPPAVEPPAVEPPAVESPAVESPVASPALSQAPLGQAAGPGPAGGDYWREGEVPILGELAPAVMLGGVSPDSPFMVWAGGLSVRVEGELITRLEGLVAFTGQLAFKPEMKRFRGRTTDKPFGDGLGRVVRATGRGMLFIEPSEKRTFQAVELGDESAYFRDESVFAFEEPVMFENGRVPSDVAPDLDLVHLRGNGKVLLSLAGPLRSVLVTMEAAATVPLTHLVGWQGNLTPRVVPLLQGPGGEILKTAVELSGEGFALLSLPVR